MTNNLPLKDVIVLDLTSILSGPFATQILSDLGADVIKIEKPTGDDSRNFGPFIKKKSSYFISLNRGKKSIVLDLKKNNEDKIFFEKLLRKSDVLIENFKPGTLEKLGYTSSFFKKINPKIIQAKISGFGETGPKKEFPAYDIIVQAMGGLMSITGQDKNNNCRVGTSIGDIAAGLYAVIGILVQLIHRKNTDLGSRLDISMLDCQVAILENAISRFSVEKKIPYPLGTDHPTITPFGAFKTKDSYIVIAIGNDKLFKNFCKAIGSKELFYDNFFKNNELRNKNLKKLRKLVEEKLEKKNTDFWTKIFSEYEVPHSKINNIEEVTNNEQVISRDMILNYNYDSIKNLKISGNPIKLSFVKKKRESKKSPELNENREEIINKFKLNEL
tara:strand:- start:199 stop:1359 length:1161 start_codon:yes stop_codon:yes gene_type:complete